MSFCPSPPPQQQQLQPPPPPLLIRVVPLWAMWLTVYCFCICCLCAPTLAALAPATTTTTAADETRHLCHHQEEQLQQQQQQQRHRGGSQPNNISISTAHTPPLLLLQPPSPQGSPPPPSLVRAASIARDTTAPSETSRANGPETVAATAVVPQKHEGVGRIWDTVSEASDQRALTTAMLNVDGWPMPHELHTLARRPRSTTRIRGRGTGPAVKNGDSSETLASENEPGTATGDFDGQSGDDDWSQNRSAAMSAILGNIDRQRPQGISSEDVDDSRPNDAAEQVPNDKEQYSASSSSRRAAGRNENLAFYDHPHRRVHNTGQRSPRSRRIVTPLASATHSHRMIVQHRHGHSAHELSEGAHRYRNGRQESRRGQTTPSEEQNGWRSGAPPAQRQERVADETAEAGYFMKRLRVRPSDAVRDRPMGDDADPYRDQAEVDPDPASEKRSRHANRADVSSTDQGAVSHASNNSLGGTQRWEMTPDDEESDVRIRLNYHQQQLPSQQVPQKMQQTPPGGNGASNSKKGVKKGQASIVYTAVAGGAVNLPCSLASESDEDDEVALVLWYKDDISAPLFTVDARGVGDIQSARQSSLDQLKERANFILASSASTYISYTSQADDNDSTSGSSSSTSHNHKRKLSQTLTRQRLQQQQQLLTSGGGGGGGAAAGVSGPAFAAHLRVEPVREADEGEYRCRVDFKRARSINTVVNLRVIVPPGDPVIETRSGVILRGGLAGPFNDGDPLTLHCYTADVGRPRGTLVWVAEGGRVIDDTFSYEHIDTHHHQAVVARNTLEINALSRDHLLTTLACRASNNNITAPSQTTITLDLNLKPLDINVEPSPPRPLSAGVPIEFVCVSSGSRPPAILTWWKGDKQIQATKEDLTGDGSSSSTSVLVFTPEPEDDGDVLVCRAENPAMSSSEGERFGGRDGDLESLSDRRSLVALEYSRTLDVHYAPRLKLVLGGGVRSGDIREGRDVYLECEISAKPAAHEIVWHFEGSTELHTDKEKGIIVSGSSLVLQAVSRSQRGWYTCSASNREGTTRSGRLFLRVKYAPRCRSQQRRVYGVDLHESAQIRCDVEADPEENTHFRWTFNNSMGKRAELNSQPATASHRTSRSMINYKPLTEQDYGELLCFGSNEVGEQVDPCIIHIVAAATPDPLENCSQVNATESSLTVECFEGAWNGGGSELFALSFVAELFTSNENEVNDASDMAVGQLIANATVDGSTSSAATGTPAVPVFVFNDLPLIDDKTSMANGHNDVGYRVHIYARNHKGRSAVTTLTVHLLNPSKYQTKQSARLGVSWLVRPLLGLVLGLLILITLGGFALFALLKCSKYKEQHHIHHNQQKQTQPEDKALESQTHSNGHKSVVLSMLKSEATDAGQCEDSTEVMAPLSGEGGDSDSHCDSILLHSHPNLIGVAGDADVSGADSDRLTVGDPGPPDIIQRQQPAPGSKADQRHELRGVISSLAAATRLSEDNVIGSDGVQPSSADVYHRRVVVSNGDNSGSNSNLGLVLTKAATLREDSDPTGHHSGPHQTTLGVYATLRLCPPQLSSNTNGRGSCGSLNTDTSGMQPTTLGVSSHRQQQQQQLQNHTANSLDSKQQRVPVAATLANQTGASLWFQPNGGGILSSITSPSAIGMANLSSNVLHLNSSSLVTTPAIAGTDLDDGGFIVNNGDSSATSRTLRDRWKKQHPPSSDTPLPAMQSAVSPLLPQRYTTEQYQQVEFGVGTTPDTPVDLDATGTRGQGRNDGLHTPGEAVMFSNKLHLRAQRKPSPAAGPVGVNPATSHLQRRGSGGGGGGEQQERSNTGHSVESAV